MNASCSDGQPHVTWTFQVPITCLESSRQPGVYMKLSPKMHVMEVTLLQEEEEKINSHSTFDLGHGT
jgi:hypothetical protein